MSITEPKLRTHVERVVRLMKNLSEDLPRAASALSPAKGLNNSDSRPTSRRSIKPSMSKVRIGDLDLEASEAWGFRQMGPMVLARRDAGCGSLQISTAFRYKLQGAQTL